MGTHVVRVRASIPEGLLNQRLANLEDILFGKSRKYAGLRRRFWSVVLQEFFRRLHRSLMAKTRRHADDLGNQWLPLKPKTIKRKSRKHWRRGVILPPSRWPDNRNRDTGDLIESFRPGILSGDVYTKVKNQIAKLLEAGGVEVGTSIEYADEAFETRPVFVDGYEKWLTESIAVAITKILPELGKP